MRSPGVVIRPTRVTGPGSASLAIFAVLSAATVPACRASSATAPSSKGASAWAIAIEGECPKLRAHGVGAQTVLVLGTYGLDEGSAWTGRPTSRAAQAFALVRPTVPANASSARTAAIETGLLEGLPRTSTGWAEGDLEIGGAFPNAVWLERTLRTPAATNKGALFEVTHDGFTWSGTSWRGSAGKDALLRGPHTMLPAAAILCPGDDIALSLLATERTPDGTTFIAGRCEDALHRPTGPLLLGRYDVTARAWQRIAAPASVLFEGPDAIVNAGIVALSPRDAFVYAYRPFTETDHERAYLVRLEEERASLVDVPFRRSIVSLARSAADQSVWAITGFSELRRLDANGRWEGPLAMPALPFVEPPPPPSAVRLLDVQIAGKDVWVHGAVPIVHDDGSAGRAHVLYTSAPWSSPLHCDRRKPLASALVPSSSSTKMKLGVLPKHAPEPSL